MENQDTRQRTETELRYLPAQQVGHPVRHACGRDVVHT